MERFIHFITTKSHLSPTDTRSHPEGLYFPTGIKLARVASKGVRNKSMQDATAINFNHGIVLASIFDGHGKKGKKIALFAAQHLHQHCFAELQKDQSPLQALSSAYSLTQAEINKKKSLSSSGATAVTACIKNGELYIANVGDSPAVLVTQNDVSTPSQYHKWEGKIEHDGELNITRSLGDTEYRIREISHEPFTKSIKLTSDARYLLLLSDGVREELLKKGYLIRILRIPEAEDPIKVCEVLLKLATDENNSNEDDISIIAINLQTIPSVNRFA